MKAQELIDILKKVSPDSPVFATWEGQVVNIKPLQEGQTQIEECEISETGHLESFDGDTKCLVLDVDTG